MHLLLLLAMLLGGGLLLAAAARQERNLEAALADARAPRLDVRPSPSR